MSRREGLYNRRTFIANSLVAATSLGAGLLTGRNLFADRTQVAFKIDDLPQSHPLIPALKFGADSLDSLSKVTDYKATFLKKELVGRKTLETRMEIKLREQPFSVYLKFLQPNGGREVIYVEGRNNGQLQVHEVGFKALAGTVSLDPTGSYAMDENRHPITMIGMKNMISTLMKQWIVETKLDGVTVNHIPDVRVGNIACKAIETSYREQIAGTMFQSTRLYIDREHGWPVRLQSYDFPSRKDKTAPLAEDYTYNDLSANVGLNDQDFSTKNPKYGF